MVSLGSVIVLNSCGVNVCLFSPLIGMIVLQTIFEALGRSLGRAGSVSIVQSSLTLLSSAPLLLTVSDVGALCQISFYKRLD